MEPPMWQTILTIFIIYPVPFLSFWFGVYISIRLGLHGSMSRKVVFLMSVPVGIVTVGNFFVIANPGDFLDGYTKFGSFLVLLGTLMFYGTLVPQMFAQMRRQHS